MDYSSSENDELHNLPNRHGSYTTQLLDGLRDSTPLTSLEALDELTMEITPFNERLTEYVSCRLAIPNEVKPVKKALRKASEEKGLGFSSANLSQWITKEKWEIYVSPRSIFKLCLALELDIPEAKRFTYECLYQNWLNYRTAEEAIYIFFIGCQELFKNRTYQTALETIEWYKSIETERSVVTEFMPEELSASGYTRIISSKIGELSNIDHQTQEQALNAFRSFLVSNSQHFTGIQRSAMETYNTYFKEGGIGIRPLVDLYREEYGLTLPETSYLDSAYVQEDSTRKRLLWGTVNRKSWLETNERDLDILQDREIRTEEHAVGKMRENGIPRGNIVALLFFQFCFENAGAATNPAMCRELFEIFYRRANTVLIDECGMMPLHPRKPLDALFMRSVASSGSRHPIEYLNQVLEDFYSK